MGFNLDRMVERMQKEREIRCPHCGCLEDDQEVICSVLISYHGSEDGAVKLDCSACDQPFFVVECIERTYEVGKTKEEAEDV